MDPYDIERATSDSLHVHPEVEKFPSSLAFDDILTARRADEFRQTVFARQSTENCGAFLEDPDVLVKRRLPATKVSSRSSYRNLHALGY